MYKLILIFLLLTKANAFGQKEYNNWYFGDYAGITFNGQTPTALTDGQWWILEGGTTYSDANGDLQLYSEGNYVYNAIHGPLGSFSGSSTSTQSGLILKQPLNDTLFLVFGSAYHGNGGLSVSRINMNLNGGLGAMDFGFWNVGLITPVVEKIAVTHHANGVDYWVVVHEWYTNKFYSYLVTDQGVQMTPVISSVGSVHNGSGSNTQGQMKISPDGTKLVYCSESMMKNELFNFNNATGVVSNVISLPAYSSQYGVEFSPDGSKIYFASWNGGAIYQYNVLTTAWTLIQPIATDANGALQLGPDGKIYVERRFSGTHLGVIHAPNLSPNDCDYETEAVFLEGKTSGAGLPHCVASSFEFPKFNHKNYCNGESTCFRFVNNTLFDSLVWNFGDGSNTVSEVSNIGVCHQYSSGGQYEISLLTWNGGVADTSIQTLIISEPFIMNSSITICEGDSVFAEGQYQYSSGVFIDSFRTVEGCDSIISLNLTVKQKEFLYTENVCSGGSYTYPDGTVASNILIDESHISNLVGSNGCDSIITTNLTVVEPYSGAENVSVCSGQNYTYPDGTVSTNIVLSESHVSKLIGSKGCDSVITTTINITESYQVSDTVMVCKGESFTYADGTTSLNIQVPESHTSYFTTSEGCDSLITTFIEIQGNLTYTIVQNGNELTVNSSGSQFQWIQCNKGFDLIPGATDSIFVLTQNASYAVIITSENCTDTSTCYSVTDVSDESVINALYTVYPNPTTGKFVVQSPIEGELVVCDLTGRMMTHGKLNEEIDLSNQPSGIYFIFIDNYAFRINLVH